MRNPFHQEQPTTSTAQSFLPSDYLEKKAERRTNIVSLALFFVITLGLIGAFFVTTQQWNDVRHYQEAINVRYAQAAQDIDQLKVLEARKDELLDKAELTIALIERVPRSILLAELINRMPKSITLLELELTSTREKVAARSKRQKTEDAKSLADKNSRKSKSKSKAPAQETDPKPEAPKFTFKLVLVGIAPEHTEVAAYARALDQSSLLNNVEIKLSEVTIIKDTEMREFRIEAILSPTADARELTPRSSGSRLTDSSNPLEGSGRIDPDSQPIEQTAEVPWWKEEN